MVLEVYVIHNQPLPIISAYQLCEAANNVGFGFTTLPASWL